MLDNLHIDLSPVFGFNLPFIFVVSEREAGKSTATWLWRYFNWKKDGSTTLVIRRKQVHITSVYIEDIARVINKFIDEPIQFSYSKASLKDGVVDVFIGDLLFMRVIGLSVDITVVKSGMLPNLTAIVFDEFICNRQFGEKYLKNEATKFLEVYNTFRRESKNLKCLFLGNPYSLYNPYFVYFNIPTSKLVRGSLFTDKQQYVVWCYEIKPELKKKILEDNPLYKFDNAYTRYAFNGENVLDENIMISPSLPPNFSLFTVFGIENKYIGLFRNNDYSNLDYMFMAKFLNKSEISKRRDIYVFEMDDLVDRTTLMCREDLYKFARIKTATRTRAIVFESIECYYLFEEIFKNL